MNIEERMISELQSSLNEVRRYQPHGYSDEVSTHLFREVTNRYISQMRFTEAVTGKHVISDGWVVRFDND